MNDRIIELKSITNIRDLGGMVNEEGKVIRRKALIRSAFLNKASEEDLQILKNEYRLKTVIDLRMDRERNERPDIIPDGVDYLIMPVFGEDKVGISNFIIMIENGLPVLEMLYKSIIENECSQKNFNTILNTILDHDFDSGSILWHCTEGKDRCGLVSAFIEIMLGISEEKVYEDYLLTNIVNGPKAERIRERELANGSSEAFAEGVKNVFLAKESYLDAALNTVKERYGSYDNYLINVIGLSEEKIRRFRERILE